MCICVFSDVLSALACHEHRLNTEFITQLCSQVAE